MKRLEYKESNECRPAWTIKEKEFEELEAFARTIVEAGIGLVACQRLIHPHLRRRLSEAGVLSLERLSMLNIAAFRSVRVFAGESKEVEGRGGEGRGRSVCADERCLLRLGHYHRSKVTIFIYIYIYAYFRDEITFHMAIVLKPCWLFLSRCYVGVLAPHQT